MSLYPGVAISVVAATLACSGPPPPPPFLSPADEAAAAFGLTPLVQDSSVLAGFRLILLRSFEPSRALELVRRPDGIWLRTSLLTGPRGPVASATVQRVPHSLWARVANTVEAAGPCLIPEPDSRLGLDGEDWWLEFKTDACTGTRHRWAPFDGPADEGTVRFSQVASAIEWAAQLAAQ